MDCYKMIFKKANSVKAKAMHIKAKPRPGILRAT